MRRHKHKGDHLIGSICAGHESSVLNSLATEMVHFPKNTPVWFLAALIVIVGAPPPPGGWYATPPQDYNTVLDWLHMSDLSNYWKIPSWVTSIISSLQQSISNGWKLKIWARVNIDGVPHKCCYIEATKIINGQCTISFAKCYKKHKKCPRHKHKHCHHHHHTSKTSTTSTTSTSSSSTD